MLQLLLWYLRLLLFWHACLTDVDVWLASRFRVSPTKTHVMCPGSSQQVAKLDITHVQVLSSYLTVQDTARDISALWSTAGPIGSRRSGLSKRLSPAAPATAVPWAVRSVSDDASEGVRFLSPGLLQLSVLRHLRRTDESAAFRNNLFTYLLTYLLGVRSAKRRHQSPEWTILRRDIHSERSYWISGLGR